MVQSEHVSRQLLQDNEEIAISFQNYQQSLSTRLHFPETKTKIFTFQDEFQQSENVIPHSPAPSNTSDIDITRSSYSTASNTNTEQTSISRATKSGTESEYATPRSKKAKTKADQILEKVATALDSTDDRFVTIGKNFANKLRDLPKETAILAEKFMTDILFEAELGNLTRSSKIKIDNTLTENVEPTVNSNSYMPQMLALASQPAGNIPPATSTNEKPILRPFGTFSSNFSVYR